jgi:hypothetical protein
MKSLIALVLFMSTASVAFADVPDDVTLDIISKGCQKDAEKAFEKAAEDAVKLMGAYGGNPGNALLISINEARPHFIAFYAYSCEADAIRKFDVKTLFPID